MNLFDILKSAKEQIIFFGVLPIAQDLLNITSELQTLLDKKPDLKLTILYESETDLFNKSLILNSSSVKNRITFRELKNKIERIKDFQKYLFKYDANKQKWFTSSECPHKLYQVNLQHTFYAIIIDSQLYYCPQFLELPKFDNYIKISENNNLYQEIKDLLSFYINGDKGGIYLSEPHARKDKMLVMYDKGDTPRGIYPRPAFYNTDFQRYSVWLLIFNRKGELLLHKRSENAKDNANLWDKSAGGHVDITDKSSAKTAEKELIEELYMSKAEYTKHVDVQTDNMINLGEWKPKKRGNELALEVFKSFGEDDFGYFFIKDQVKRTSRRRFYDEEKQENYYKETKFMSDVFLFIAPDGELEDEDSLDSLSSFAGIGHRLITIQKLKNEISIAKQNRTADDDFTDDLLYIVEHFEDLLLQFSEYIRFVFNKG